ncbi:MAG: hypothetical protein K2P46_00890, partial [Alistipes sp.]|nr:hypothetical protein [Alistipes sp.]
MFRDKDRKIFHIFDLRRRYFVPAESKKFSASRGQNRTCSGYAEARNRSEREWFRQVKNRAGLVLAMPERENRPERDELRIVNEKLQIMNTPTPRLPIVER